MSQPLRPDDPRMLGRYELDGRLGEGGMGTVFHGRTPAGRPVAVKVVRSEFTADPEFLRRFRSEVNRARQVPPFSTAEVLDADPDHQPPYLVVEYVDGPSLDAVVKQKGPLGGAALHSVAVGIATALSGIHGAGVIHRDLKPANVLLAMGGVKVIDFGIARPLDVTSRHTGTGNMVGTVAYMAPERIDSDDAGFPADIFAWGVVVAFAATGRTPFGGDSPTATAMRILTQPPNLTGLDGPLRSVVERTLAKDPAARPTARELLDTLLGGSTSSMPPPTSPAALPPGPSLAAPLTAPAQPAPELVPADHTPHSGRRRGWAFTAAIVACAVAAGGVGIILRDRHSDASTATPPPATASRSPAPAPAPEKTGLPGVLDGSRRTLIHLANIDKDLALPQNAPAKAGGGTTPESVFVLIPHGKQYQIASTVPSLSNERRCLGIEPSDTQASSPLVPTTCKVSDETLFTLAPTDEFDDKNRPTYSLVSEPYGIVQWSETDARLYIELAGDFPASVPFSFVDRGPV
ncbi:protein kinase [Actinoplanes sp. NPDC049596]|uniref:serine/threonine protein kinase n=1 Tax=unclassified Actinoplanes TaxID=2626549 RepID=UPI0034144744